MGSNTSKQNSEAACPVLKVDADVNSDPRSPTPEISRTPLHGKGGSKHNITKNVDLSKAFEGAGCDEKLIHNNPILSAVIKNHLQSYDPRSPTQDFERTPIVIASKTDEGTDMNVLRVNGANDCGSPMFATATKDRFFSEKNIEAVVPKNLCEGFFDLTLDDTLKQSDIPLGSSTASNDSIEKNMSNVERPTHLLETNFDYVETDIDQYRASDEDLTNFADVKYKQKFKILENDPRSPSAAIERTPIVVAKAEGTNEKNVEEMSDDTLIKVLQNTNAELRLTAADQNPDGLLIYEDEAEATNNIDDTPKKSKSICNGGSRTPLSCMKNKTDPIHTPSKSANQLIDPKGGKLPTSKIAKRVSQIPRLKSLTKQSLAATSNSSISLKNFTKTAVVGGDCENTPPHSHRDCWDVDNSIVL